MASPNNPLISDSPLETAQNTSEALSALIALMSDKHSDVCRLMSPIVHSLEYLSDQLEDYSNKPHR